MAKAVQTTEMFDPVNQTVCMSSSLPSPGRALHSLEFNLTCGGMGDNETKRTCDVWNGREWERAGVTLSHPRFDPGLDMMEFFSWAVESSGIVIVQNL